MSTTELGRVIFAFVCAIKRPRPCISFRRKITDESDELAERLRYSCMDWPHVVHERSAEGIEVSHRIEGIVVMNTGRFIHAIESRFWVI